MPRLLYTVLLLILQILCIECIYVLPKPSWPKRIRAEKKRRFGRSSSSYSSYSSREVLLLRTGVSPDGNDSERAPIPNAIFSLCY
jgi:hypothetical protein